MIKSIVQHISDRLSGKAPAGARRSGKWPAVRAAHLALHPTCAVCAGKKRLQVHHLIPFHLRPELELEPLNLITLCESRAGGVNCHLFVGHLGNYRHFNAAARADAATFSHKIARARQEIDGG